MSKLTRAISENGGVIIYAIDSTDIIKELQVLHEMSATAVAALGRLLTGNVLMSATLKNEKDSISLRIAGDGPGGILLTEVRGTGEVRGYIENPHADLSSTSLGKLNVKGLVGTSGTLYVIKDLGLKEPQIGMVPLVSGEIAEDITSYYANSEQIPTVCALGVLIDKDLSVLNSGGFLLQLLPGATDDEISTIENNINNMPSITHYLQNSKTIVDIIDDALTGFTPNILDEQEIYYHCSCNAARFEKSLITLGKEELQRIASEGDDIEIKCQFCNKIYHFSAESLLSNFK